MFIAEKFWRIIRTKVTTTMKIWRYYDIVWGPWFSATAAKLCVCVKEVGQGLRKEAVTTRLSIAQQQQQHWGKKGRRGGIGQSGLAFVKTVLIGQSVHLTAGGGSERG